MSKRLNAVLRWMQANPPNKFSGQLLDPHISDVWEMQHSREEEAGHSLRGALFLRSSNTNHGGPNRKTANNPNEKRIIANHNSPTIFTQSCVIHIVDATCKAQRHVTRSTFSSELLT